MSKKETETVEVTVTVELPKKVHDFLSDFCKFAGTTLTDMLQEETIVMIKNFYQGGFYEGLTKDTFKNRGVSEYFNFRE
jgi:hypothetical protein